MLNDIICPFCEEIIYPNELSGIYEEGTDYYECPSCREEICIETEVTYEFTVQSK